MTRDPFWATKEDESRRLLRHSARELLKREIAPLVSEYERDGRMIDREVLRRIAPLGALGGLLPPPYGANLPYSTYFVLIEELGRIWGSLRTVAQTTASVANIIAELGTDEQRRRYLPPLVAGDYIACFAWTEPEAGSDTLAIMARAEADGESLVLTGTKTLVTNAGSADVAVIAVRFDTAIRLIVVSTAETPIPVRPIAKMGLDSSDLGELVLDGVRVPRTALLADRATDPSLLVFGRVGIAFAALGSAEAAFEQTLRWVRQRRQFGRPLASFQLVQAELAAMKLAVDAMRFFAERAAWRMDRGEPAILEASLAKLHNTEAALDVVARAMQLAGGYGYTRDLGLERRYRDLRHLTIGEGTSDIHRLIIGRELTGVDAIASEGDR
ncbi:MAG: acyl-CoA dehydrogenase [Dehalococcoidia bacterium]|nr:MAG: acyl-CoA dehydrogenase [Dehalococcoidia bacterium]